MLLILDKSNNNNGSNSNKTRASPSLRLLLSKSVLPQDTRPRQKGESALPLAFPRGDDASCMYGYLGSRTRRGRLVSRQSLRTNCATARAPSAHARTLAACWLQSAADGCWRRRLSMMEEEEVAPIVSLRNQLPASYCILLGCTSLGNKWSRRAMLLTESTPKRGILLSYGSRYGEVDSSSQ